MTLVCKNGGEEAVWLARLHDWLIRGWQNYVAYGCQNNLVVVDPQTVQAVQTLANGTANIKVRTRTRTHMSHTHACTHAHHRVSMHTCTHIA